MVLFNLSFKTLLGRFLMTAPTTMFSGMFFDDPSHQKPFLERFLMTLPTTRSLSFTVFDKFFHQTPLLEPFLMTHPTRNPFWSGSWDDPAHQKPFLQRFWMTPTTRSPSWNGFWWPLIPERLAGAVVDDPSHQKTVSGTVFDDPSHQKPFLERFLMTPPTRKLSGTVFDDPPTTRKLYIQNSSSMICVPCYWYSPVRKKCWGSRAGVISKIPWISSRCSFIPLRISQISWECHWLHKICIDVPGSHWFP